MSQGPDLGALDKAVAIMTTGRTGSGFVASLLDDHPNVLSLPDCILTSYAHFWDQFGDLASEQVTDRFITYYAIVFDGDKGSDCPRLQGITGASLGLHHQ